MGGKWSVEARNYDDEFFKFINYNHATLIIARGANTMGNMGIAQTKSMQKTYITYIVN